MSLFRLLPHIQYELSRWKNLPVQKRSFRSQAYIPNKKPAEKLPQKRLCAGQSVLCMQELCVSYSNYTIFCGENTGRLQAVQRNRKKSLRRKLHYNPGRMRKCIGNNGCPVKSVRLVNPPRSRPLFVHQKYHFLY